MTVSKRLNLLVSRNGVGSLTSSLKGFRISPFAFHETLANPNRLEKRLARTPAFDSLCPRSLFPPSRGLASCSISKASRSKQKGAPRSTRCAPTLPAQQPLSYGLQAVSIDGEVQELDDDQIVCTARIFKPILKVIPRKGTREEQKFNLDIGNLIGKRLNEFDSMRDLEVAAFRKNILGICRVRRRGMEPGKTGARVVAKTPWSWSGMGMRHRGRGMLFLFFVAPSSHSLTPPPPPHRMRSWSVRRPVPWATPCTATRPTLSACPFPSTCQRS